MEKIFQRQRLKSWYKMIPYDENFEIECSEFFSSIQNEINNYMKNEKGDFEIETKTGFLGESFIETEKIVLISLVKKIDVTEEVLKTREKVSRLMNSTT